MGYGSLVFIGGSASTREMYLRFSGWTARPSSSITSMMARMPPTMLENVSFLWPECKYYFREE